MKKRKQKTPRQKIEEKLDDITREINRATYKNICCKCGRPIFGLNSQKAHVKSAGAYPHMKFDIKNMILLCYHDHIGWWHHEPTEAGAWFKKTFPGKYKYLEKAKNLRTHHSVEDLEKLYDRYKKKLYVMTTSR